ncbi:MAG: MTH1187 family thiamine-binding protein [Planctomycetales bacterium]|nr:MTH1187 family thiamine-binding protein [Planctomycetales bacterium]
MSAVVLLEFSIAPLEKGTSVSEYVARSLKIIDASGLDYRLHAMGTIVEGELDQVLEVLRDCMKAMAADCDRITCTAKMDYRRGHSGRLATKVESVVEKLDTQLKTL